MASHKDCIACQQQLHSSRRSQAVHNVSARLGDDRLFPKMYRLLDRMPLCAHCLNDLPLIDGPICSRCGRPLSRSDRDEICGDCALHPASLLINRSLLRYTDWGKSLISRYKYRGDERLANLFADFLVINYLRNFRQLRLDVISYVPSHQSRLEERGFNQSEQLASFLSKSIRVPVVPFLVRSKQTPKLSKQAGRSSRYESLQEAFVAGNSPQLQSYFEKNDPLHILLVDDIFTTGATVRSCAAAIGAMPFVCPPQFYSLSIFR